MVLEKERAKRDKREEKIKEEEEEEEEEKRKEEEGRRKKEGDSQVWNARILYRKIWNLNMVLYGYMFWVVWNYEYFYGN